MLSNDTETKEAGKKLVIDFTLGIVLVVLSVLIMTFLIKPAINWVLNLL